MTGTDVKWERQTGWISYIALPCSLGQQKYIKANSIHKKSKYSKKKLMVAKILVHLTKKKRRKLVSIFQNCGNGKSINRFRQRVIAGRICFRVRNCRTTIGKNNYNFPKKNARIVRKQEKNEARKTLKWNSTRNRMESQQILETKL